MVPSGEKPELSKAVSLKPGVGELSVPRLLPGMSAFRISTFQIHSTAFSESLSTRECHESKQLVNQTVTL